MSSFVSPPAEQLAVSAGGVDMRTGSYAYSQTDLSIGEASEGGGLALTRTMSPGVVGHEDPFAPFSHNWDIMLTERRVDITTGKYEQGAGQDFRVSVHFGGRSETFEAPSTSASFTQTSRTSQATLTYSGTRTAAGVVYSFQATDGTLVTFRPLGNGDCTSEGRCAYPAAIVLPEGTRFSFEYETASPGVANMTRLRSVTSSRGYALLLEYGGTNGNWNEVSKACVINLAVAIKPANNVCPASAAATSSYSYTGGALPFLASATDPAQAVWGFTYASANGITHMGFVRPGETSPWLINELGATANGEGEFHRIVLSQQFADGRYYGYDWFNSQNATQGTIDRLAGGAYSGPQGVTSLEYGFFRRPRSMNPPRFDVNQQVLDNYGDAYYQVTPGPIRITDPLGRTTVLDYCDPIMAQSLPASDTDRCVVTLLQSFTDPEGARTILEYGGRLVVKTTRQPRPGSTLAPLVVETLYDCSSPKTCNSPNLVRDARGNVTNIAYSPDHGGVLSETGPAPSAGATRPQTRHEYAQRTAWIANGSGGYVAAGPPIWVRTATSSCRTSAATGNPAAPCAVAGDEVRTSYDYGPDSGPNNLLLRGQTVTAADGGVTTTLRTCYGYDARGRRISETQPNANLASCP